MRQLDARAQTHFEIPVLLLMDHAGRAVAEAARPLCQGSRSRIVVVTGGGNNGGDGVAAARWLAGWGFPVTVLWLKNPSEWSGDPAHHVRMARRAGVQFRSYLSIPAAKRIAFLRRAGVLIDAILGTGTKGLLRLDAADAIIAMNASRRPIVAVDLPSGLDPDTGETQDVAVRAHTTVTLVAPKAGFKKPAARKHLGRLRVADIGFPASLLLSSR